MGSEEKIVPAPWSEVKSILRGIADFADASSEEQSMTLYSAIAVVDAAIAFIIAENSLTLGEINAAQIKLEEAVKRLEGKENFDDS